MIRAKKSLGQNFLVDKNILTKITNSVTIENKEIFEVGPGIPLGSPDSSFDEPWKEKKSDVKYIPTQAEIGDYALFLGKASIEIKIEEKDYLIVSKSAILILIRDDLGRVLA